MATARIIPTTQPADLATYTIKVDGENLPADIQVKTIVLVKEVNKIPSLRLRISDGDPAMEDFPVSNGELFIPGKEIELMMGYHSDDISVFKGIIIQHSNRISSSNSELMVECKDKAVKMTIARKNKHYNDVSDSDVAEQAITSYGLEADIESSPITHKDLVQYEQTDWDFVLSRMDMVGKICLVSDGKITCKKPDLNATPELDVLFGATIINYSGEIDARTQLKSLAAASWDFSSQTIAEVNAEEPSLAAAGDISNDSLSDVLGIEDYKLNHSGHVTQEAMQSWADAKLQKQRLAKITGTVKFQGYPQLQPGMFISLNGVGNRFNGPVFVNTVRHEYSRGDWTTEVVFGMKPQWYSEIVNPYHPESQYGRMPSVHGLIIGVVTDLEDPEGEDRVKIKLPSVSEGEEGIWARLATTDAGNQRGTYFRPEIGDEVIAGFIQGDASHAIILGMLNSSAKPAPIKASNNNHEKGYISRAQMKMVFNDDEKSLKIETPAGKKITVSEQDAIIKIEDENGNKITMESSGITVEAAATLTLKGGASVKIEAPSVSINGSGSTEIKGGLVTIN